MTDSLIPYLFVPGTKAKANEVNANFAAVAEAINSSVGAISDLEDNIDEKLELCLDLNLSNSRSVTNCIVSAPNGVAVFSGLSITAKAGIKLLMPNGRNTDGSLKNQVYTLETDVSATDTISAGKRIFALTSEGNLSLIYKDFYLKGNDISKPSTLSDTNTYLYYAIDTNKFYITSGSTDADWTDIKLCVLGEYLVSNSVIANFEVCDCLNLTENANKSLSNLDNKAVFNILKPTNSAMLLNSNGQIATIGSITYYKSYDEECFCAVTKISNSGTLAPILVGKTERSVTGYTSANSTPSYTGTIDWNGETFYYYSPSDRATSGASITKKGSFPVIYESFDYTSDMAKKVLDMYYHSVTYSMPVENYQNGSSWYRIWGDGWCEQGGLAQAGSNTSGATTNFLKSYSNTNYNLFAKIYETGTTFANMNVVWVKITNRTASGFTATSGYNTSSGNSYGYSWYACGYIG